MLEGYSEKKEFLEHCMEVARHLEEKTNKFYEVRIGWLDSDLGDLTVTIMVNHESGYFGSFEEIGWNKNVLFSNIGRFIPVKNPYLQLNKLIDMVVYDK